MAIVPGCINPQELAVAKDLEKKDRLPRIGDSFVFCYDTHRVWLVRRRVDGLVVIHSSDLDGLTHHGFLNFVRLQVFLLGQNLEKSQLDFGGRCVVFDIR